jgi:dGTPase
MNRLQWKNLLRELRVRPLMGGPDSVKSEKEMRTDFERDYGRTIYSAPFRRLKQKTQVFPLETHDFVRTRLVHSQEVSSVAEDLAAQVARSLLEKGELERTEFEAVSLIAATCGLIHDLGNPPFGHAGELAISSWFQKKQTEEPSFFDGLTEQQKQDFLKFEGNAHTLRIISNLFLISDHYGLNYTCATFSAARKYLASSDTTNKDIHRYSFQVETWLFFIGSQHHRQSPFSNRHSDFPASHNLPCRSCR